jgi:hypothetical protein
MEMKKKKKEGDVNLKTTIPNKDNARSKSTEECEMLNYLCNIITMIQDVHVKLNPRLHGTSSIQQEGYFRQPIGLKFKEETSKVVLEAFLSMALKVRLFGKYTRNTCKVLKYCAGEERRRSAGPFV